MRNRIFGAIGVIWGFSTLQFAWSTGINRDADSAYRFGQYLGFGLGALLFFVGMYYLIKGDGDWPWRSKMRKTTKRRGRTTGSSP